MNFRIRSGKKRKKDGDGWVYSACDGEWGGGWQKKKYKGKIGRVSVLRLLHTPLLMNLLTSSTQYKLY